MILITKTSDQTRQRGQYVCMYVCMFVCIFIKLHITAQSGPVIESFYATRIDPPKGGSMILVTKTSDQTRMYACMYVCMYVCMYACMYVCIY